MHASSKQLWLLQLHVSSSWVLLCMHEPLLTICCLVFACVCVFSASSLTHSLTHSSQANKCFVLDLDQRAFLAAVKDRQAAGLAPVPASPHMAPAADNSSRLASGPILVNPATYFGSSTSSGFSNTSWPVGQSVLDFFWGELTLSEGAPFECLTPDGKSTVSEAGVCLGNTLSAKKLPVCAAGCQGSRETKEGLSVQAVSVLLFPALCCCCCCRAGAP
jgi:hypothetical protein